MADGGQLTSNTHAVLKLQLGDKGGTRRIAFSRLWDTAGSNVSYAKLKSLAIEYSFPEDAPHDVKNYNVVVTYLDEDGDNITVSSNAELAEAFMQFVGKTPPVLRANATVKRSEAAVKPTPGCAPSPPPEDTDTTAPAAPHRPSTSPSTPTRQSSRQNSFGQQAQNPKLQVLHVLESFVSILASAVIALQGHLNPGPDGLPPGTPPRRISSDEAANLTATATPEAAALARSHSEDGQENSEDAEKFAREVIEKINLGGEDAKEAKSDEPKEEEKKASVKDSDSVLEGLNPQFIHGRHTCDGCLCTPIVGIRYHAQNLPDYDLCQKCINNYKGEDIKFEPVELDRDRPLQHRWQRRQMRRARQAKFGGGDYPGGCRGMRQQRQNLVMDAALKEAIRRSLLEANAKRLRKSEDAPKEEETKDAPKEAEEPTELDAPEPSAPPEAEVDEEIQEELKEETDTPGEEAPKDPAPSDAEVDEEKEEEAARETRTPTKEGDSNKTAPTPSSVKSTFSADAAGMGAAAEAIGATLDNCAHAIDEIVSEFEKGAKKKDGKVNTADAIASAVATAVDAASIAASVASEVAAAFDQHHGGADASDSMSAMTSSVPSVAVPKAEDKASETNQHAKDDASVGSEPEIIVEPEDAIEEGDLTLDAAERSEGATILPSVTTAEEEEKEKDEGELASDAEEDDWQVVDEAAQRDAQVANDEMLAKAAEFIGSALFQSDMQNSSEISNKSSSSSSSSSNSSSSSSSSGSGIESVPSTVPTISSEPIPAVLRTRWEQELKQLHELGFLDDRRSVDALERLEAANMGVDSTDPVTVNDAVNYLLANK